MESYEPCKVKTKTAIWELAHKSLFFDFILCVQRTHSTAVNEINVERLLRHIYELSAWFVT